MTMSRSDNSDTSFAGNRPSTIFDAPYKHSALRRINFYLSSHNFPSLSLKPLPSSRDITETLNFLLFRLEFNSDNLHRDLPLLLKSLNYPHSLNRSALKAPGTPHAFPHILAVIHYLVQLADSKERLSTDSDYDALTDLALRCYSHFIEGEDEAAEAAESEFLVKIQREKEAVEENVRELEREDAELETRIEASPLEALEVAKRDLEKDAVKLEDFVAKLCDAMEIMEKAVKDRERELDEALDGKEMILKQIEDLKRKVQEQGIDLWEADRMKRELQAVERDIKEAESKRTDLEDRIWSLDQQIRQQFKALEALAIKNNQAFKRLKLGSDLQYRLNSEGCTVEEVLGIDYKSTIKPAINSLSNEIKRSFKENSEELLVLQMKNVQINSKTEEKKAKIAEVQHSIEEMESVLDSMDKEIRDKESRCKSEAENMLKAFEAEDHNLDIQHKEAKETLKAAELRLQETEKKSKTETEKCAYELLAVIDAVSKHKEYMESKLHEMGKQLSETKVTLPNKFKRNSSPKSISFPRLQPRKMPDTQGR